MQQRLLTKLKNAHVPKRALAGCLWLVVWELVARLFGRPLVLPAPSAVVYRVSDLAGAQAFWLTLGTSFVAIAFSFVLTLILGIALAFLASKNTWLQAVIELPLRVCKSSPITALIVILLLIVGPKHVSGIAVCIAVTPQIYFAAYSAFTELDRDLKKLLRRYDVSSFRIFLAEELPSSLIWIQSAIRSGAGMAFKAAVAAELIGTPLHTIGNAIYQAKLGLETVDVFAWTAIVILLAALFEKVIVYILQALCLLTQRIALVGLPKAFPQKEKLPYTVASFSAGYTLVDGELQLAKVAKQELRAGNVLLLDAASGSGKTTVIKTLLGDLKPLKGNLVPMDSAPLMQTSLVVKGLTLYENVALCAGVESVQIYRHLARLLPDKDPTQKVETLSGGELRRLELARVLSAHKDILVLDEPTAALDAISRRVVCELLCEALTHAAIICSTHDEVLISALEAASQELKRAQFLPQTVQNSR